MDTKHTEYLLRIADTNLILGQRLAEWCGHGPILEEDIALTNISLDHIGQCTMIYEHLAETEGKGRTGDDWAFLRDHNEFRNLLLVELPNGDFGNTILRQFFFSAFYNLFLDGLKQSNDEFLRAFAFKAAKEVAYHLKHSADWVIRLGDGTEESRHRMLAALDHLWPFTGEMFMADEIDRAMAAAGIGPDLSALKAEWDKKIAEVLNEATLPIPAEEPFQKGGKQGLHTEYLGFILAEMQFLPRAMPGLKW
jgi:ring-1,2-phenylacetyl-CoA epoxidase subunit PaaC